MVVGAAPRFGSALLRLSSASLARATFCYPDSVFEPTAFAVAERMSLIALATADQQDALDDYIEAHVHGGVRLLGTALARDGRLTPRLIGDAARTANHDQQDLKRVWHYRLGRAMWSTRERRPAAALCRAQGCRPLRKRCYGQAGTVARQPLQL